MNYSLYNLLNLFNKMKACQIFMENLFGFEPLGAFNEFSFVIVITINKKPFKNFENRQMLILQG